ncbi:putative preprotein translocase subunit YajC [Gordonia hirsuta DSM 44140 = NBRC 16056]|uniref:Putative preprotein translocase subunit YajC n=1 Tax=Gordonia hirsuta DSM 44140 = NBRC 16056 TaxID=1121927 RepID=L7L8U9_9ACTN|nr:preprotein translocase subunit YajC [Gordonia hirsuta]GAC57359.1 putative preprotein translocase subunit YajC [Gordonia hirsuta DSM 44140 = NBRC 16056]
MDLFLPLLLAFAVAMLFMSFRNQKKRTQAMNDIKAQAVPGARIQLSSGLFGTVHSDDGGENIEVEIAPGVITTWNRLAIREVVTDHTDTEAPDWAADAGADEIGLDEQITEIPSDDAPEASNDPDTKDK